MPENGHRFSLAKALRFAWEGARPHIMLPPYSKSSSSAYAFPPPIPLSISLFDLQILNSPALYS